MFKRIEINNNKFHITNEVFVYEWNINKEITRYKLIKKYLSEFPKCQNIMYKCINAFRPKDDPILIEIENHETVRIPKDVADNYNKIINKIKTQMTSIQSEDINIKTHYENKFLHIEYEDIKYDIYYPKYNDKYKHNVFSALMRYDVLGFLNNSSAAVRKKVYKQLYEKDYRIELFASFYNKFLPYYFGLFYDIEHPFGCLGNLFTSNLIRGKFVANPPFEIKVMNKLMLFLRENLDKNKIKVYITIPLWYKKDREKFNETHDKKLDTTFDDFRKDLVEKYIICNKLYDIKHYTFISYITKKKMNLCDVNTFFVSSM